MKKIFVIFSLFVLTLFTTCCTTTAQIYADDGPYIESYYDDAMYVGYNIVYDNGANVFTSFLQPSTLEICVMHTSLVLGVRALRNISSVMVPSSKGSRYLRTAPVLLAACCHGSISL